MKKAVSGLILLTFLLLLLFEALVFLPYQMINDNAAIQGWRLDRVFSVMSVSQFQNITGDLVISNNQTYIIENQDFHIYGKITVKDTSSLIIQDSNFTTTPLSAEGTCIELTDQANLIITNTTVIFKRLPAGSFEGEILVQNNAKANITQSKLLNQNYLIAHQSSSIYVNNSTIVTNTTRTDYLHPSGVATFDTSSAEVKNSTLDGLFVWNNSTASANDLVIGILRFGAIEEPDKATVSVTNSKIANIESFGGAPTLYVEDSTVLRISLNDKAVARFKSTSIDDLSAFNDAFALLIGSSIGNVLIEDNATVLVGWQLPLFGVVTLPYGLIPIVQWSLVIIVIAIVAIALLLWRRRREKRTTA